MFSGTMNIDIRHTPFSRFGSYIAFSLLGEDRLKNSGLAPGLWLRCVHGDAAREVFLVEVLRNGAPVPFTCDAAPGVLTLRAEGGTVRFCIAEPDLIRIRGDGGLGLRLTARPGGNSAIPQPNDSWLLTLATAFRFYLLTALAGRLRADAPWEIARCAKIVADFLPEPLTGVFEAALEQSVGAPAPRPYPGTFDALVAAAEAEFAEFAKACCPPQAGEFAETAQAAAHLNWSAVVAPCGNFTRPAMLMSKNWMCNVWSWDHCFNALALAAGKPELAWDQFCIMFDQQLPTGQLPDYINDILRLCCFVKPPVHGWTLRRMLQANPWFADSARLTAIYGPLARWTEWWLTLRNPDGDGLPEYHHGFDSGWDNATAYDVGFPIKAPDLAAFLVVQMEVLADLATRLHKPDEAAAWRRRAAATLTALCKKLWRGNRFINVQARNGKVEEKGACLLDCLPIVLGPSLPADVRTALVARIRRHLTDWGLATEQVKSPLYTADGYWRGPIWAPPTLLIADGLARSGEKPLAQDIALRFCKLCRQSGFAENFDPVSGEPLRDRAYTWTSSVFLELLREFV